MKNNDQKASAEKPTLTDVQVIEICNEIELQWERHLPNTFLFEFTLS